MSRGPGQWLGFAEAVGAACLWASSGVFAVSLFRMGVPPESLALLRPVLGGGLLAVLVWTFRRGSMRVPRRGLVVLVAGGAVTLGAFQLAYQLSIDAVGVPTTVALLYLAPAIVAVLSGRLLDEHPTRTHLALVAVTLAGVWLSVIGAEDVTATFGSAGLLWGVVAAFGYAGYTLLGRYAGPRWGSATTAVYSTVGAVIVLCVVVPVATGPVVLPTGWRAWGLLLAFSLTTITAAQLLFFDSLARIDAGRVSVATAAEPVVAAILATVLVSQGLRPIGWVGILLVVVGVAGAGLESNEKEAPSG